MQGSKSVHDQGIGPLYVLNTFQDRVHEKVSRHESLCTKTQKNVLKYLEYTTPHTALNTAEVKTSGQENQETNGVEDCTCRCAEGACQGAHVCSCRQEGYLLEIERFLKVFVR